MPVATVVDQERDHRPHVLLQGAGNGILTIARGTLPLTIIGPDNYAYRLGLIGAPSRIAQPLAPLAFGLLLEPLGRGVVLVSAGLSLSALVALLLQQSIDNNCNSLRLPTVGDRHNVRPCHPDQPV
ncbi:hypothetical protein HMPREF9695_04455 [Afipia broomeae ATCC 49717]|uniref:Uncharacterized protein n=1 Tax=Afipia broomeae ATCC 49717 TaxID=883078 RepID=K8P4E1_9BRAD|nr:hypothetical protein HMPREF9695_04455 [Afipia broomeae ATCC 49717]